MLKTPPPAPANHAGKVSGMNVSSAPSAAQPTNVGMSVTAYGSMTPVSSSPKTRLRPRQRSRAKLNAVSEHVSTVPVTTSTSMIIVLRKYRANGCAVSASGKFSHAIGFGIHCGGLMKIWASVIKALRTSQTNGISISTAPKARMRNIIARVSGRPPVTWSPERRRRCPTLSTDRMAELIAHLPLRSRPSFERCGTAAR